MRRLAVCVVLALLALAPSAGAIVGGTHTTRSWPHMAALEFRADNGSWRFVCGASLVRPDVVLTAAHCIDGYEAAPQRFRVQLGTNDRRQSGERIDVTSVVEHPSYDTGNGGYDVALLKLSSASALGSPIPIAEAADSDRYERGDLATVIGWGATTFPGFAVDDLREARVPIRSDSECQGNYTLTASFDPETMICAGYDEGGADSCHGDSGGPLMVVDAAGRFVLVGAVSFGVGCALPTQYGIYAEVAGAELRPWVQQRLSELSPALPPPDGDTGDDAPTGGGAQTAAPPAAGAQTGAPAGAATQTGAAAGGALQPAGLLARLSVSTRLGSASRARRARRLGVVLRTTAPVRGVRVVLTQRSRTVARGSLRTLTDRARLRLRVGRGLRAGLAALTLSARDGGGRSIRLVRRVRLDR